MCEYCENKKSFGDDWTDIFIVKSEIGYFIKCFERDCSMIINFCPMCGRKLTEVK